MSIDTPEQPADPGPPPGAPPGPPPDEGSRIFRYRVLLIAGLLLIGAGVGLAWGSWRNLCATCPSIAQIRTWQPEQTSKLFSHDGRLIAELGYERRTPLAIGSLPPHVPQAIIAIEDKRFYNHPGFDVIGIARAVVGVLTGQNRGGGSTITQQLARNMFEDQIGFERRLGHGAVVRKLRELQVALELERAYTKDQILEAYMNEIYLGRGHGIQSASRGYFGKNATELNVAEAAMLAAVLNLPTYYNPFTHPDNALGRRNLVLDRMAREDYITRDEAEQWKAYPLPTVDQMSASVHGIAPWFEEWVRQILDERYGAQVYRGGLRVFTTLDADIQRAANENMTWGFDRIEALPYFRKPKYASFDTVASFPGQTPYLQGMLVALDPQTGAVRAMVGGRDFEQSKFDRVRLARRQAGSSFKPFVFTAAVASGIPVSHVIVDGPISYPESDGSEWRPKNFSNEFNGPMTLRAALRQSINMVTIKLGWEQVGIETVAQTARRMGLQTEIERFPSTTIGAAEVIPLQMAEAYATFANLGTHVRPFPILRVENADGDVIWEPQPERTQALDSAVARIMVDLLQDAANRGTGASHRSALNGGLPYDVPTAGKTGTTNDATDAWFVGFTPNLVAAIWFGMDKPQTITGSGTGGGFAAPVWGRFMKTVYYGAPDAVPAASPPAAADSAQGAQGDATPVAMGEGDLQGALPIPKPWPWPAGVTRREVDARTGRVWSRFCEGDPYTEYFIAGTEPTEVCDDSGPEPTPSMFRMPRIRMPTIRPRDTIQVGERPPGGTGGGR